MRSDSNEFMFLIHYDHNRVPRESFPLSESRKFGRNRRLQTVPFGECPKYREGAVRVGPAGWLSWTRTLRMSLPLTLSCPGEIQDHIRQIDGTRSRCSGVIRRARRMRASCLPRPIVDFLRILEIIVPYARFRIFAQARPRYSRMRNSACAGPEPRGKILSGVNPQGLPFSKKSVGAGIGDSPCF